jgi:hypothetical protein
MMSFESRELMIDILPAGTPFADPGLRMCGDATRVGGDDQKDCGDATRQPPPEKHDRSEISALELAALRGQLRQTLAAHL